ncbi:large conductance mechanosensitive channel protein MscL [Jiulongibacter sp. NS-SX5]|uniref:large conductance mechanosensitive channel protein MscL n=1 Tax=Jiulongibacter sp. NS-SX5 TaxID=3463854 RepID=UPI004058E6D8
MKFKFLKEFREFAVKGNMIDIAIGVIIGAAFNNVIDSLVKEVFMPPLSLLTDGVKLENKKWVLREAVLNGEEVLNAEVAVGYGRLLETGVDFIIIAFTVFLVVKLMHRLKSKADDPKDATVPTPKDIELLSQITSLMEKQVKILESKK